MRANEDEDDLIDLRRRGPPAPAFSRARGSVRCTTDGGVEDPKCRSKSMKFAPARPAVRTRYDRGGRGLCITRQRYSTDRATCAGPTASIWRGSFQRPECSCRSTSCCTRPAGRNGHEISPISSVFIVAADVDHPAVDQQAPVVVKAAAAPPAARARTAFQNGPPDQMSGPLPATASSRSRRNKAATRSTKRPELPPQRLVRPCDQERVAGTCSA